MANLVRSRGWGTVRPPAGAQIDWGHPLAQGIVACALTNEQGGLPVDIARPHAFSFTGGPSWGLSLRGVGWQNAAAGNGGFGWATSEFVPTNGVTFMLRKFKTDATARTVGFGVATSTDGERCGGFLPYSDGTVYWDFGGSTGNNRISKAGLTFKDDLWHFVAGTRGMSITQNGIEVAVSGTAVTRTATTTNAFSLDGLGGDELLLPGSDACVVGPGVVWNRELSLEERVWLNAEPYAFIAPPAPRILYFGPFSPPAAPPAPDSPVLYLPPPGKIAPGTRFPVLQVPQDLAYVAQAIALLGHGDNANAGAGALKAAMALAGHGDNADSGGSNLLKVAMALAGHGDNADSGSTALLNLSAALSGRGNNANTGSLATLLLGAALAGGGANSDAGQGLLKLAASLSGAGANANTGAGDLAGAAGVVATALYYRLGLHRAVAPRSHGIRD